MGGPTDNPQTYRQPDILPKCLPTTPGYYILIKFKFVPYRHILLA